MSQVNGRFPGRARAATGRQAAVTAGAASSPVRAVLFDLDGVLVDSYEAWYRVVNAAARRFGVPAVSRARLSDVFKCPVFEIYKATEGAIAISCRHGSLHINEDLVAVELIDLDGVPVPPGWAPALTWIRAPGTVSGISGQPPSAGQGVPSGWQSARPSTGKVPSTAGSHTGRSPSASPSPTSPARRCCLRSSAATWWIRCGPPPTPTPTPSATV